MKKFSQQAKALKKLISQSQRILLSLHRNPDGDSLASNLAMYLYLRSLGKKVKIISPSKGPENFDFLPNFKKIEPGIDFLDLKASDFDLFIALDAASWNMLTEREELPDDPKGEWKVVNIDHHKTNISYGDLNLVEVHKSSTCEWLSDIFLLMKVKINSTLALILLTGIVTDTGGFHYPAVTSRTLRLASDLIDKGADLKKIMYHVFRRTKPETLKYWGLTLKNMEFYRKSKYLLSKISQKELKEHDISKSYIEGAANLFLQVVEGTEFGCILTEEEDGLIRGSLRSRTDFDVSEIAVALGGGGHAAAAGFTLKGLTLDQADQNVKKVIRQLLARKKH